MYSTKVRISWVKFNLYLKGDDEKELYFIIQGKVCLLHRETFTYIVDLEKD